jgi:formylglycine-generating enzyme required for sulfatase activity
VTNKQFAEFVQQGGYDDPDNWVEPQGRFAFDGLKYLTKNKWVEPELWRDERFGKKRPLAPVVGVSWFEAMAFCRWWAKKFGPCWAESQGLQGEIISRLPTEAEWEFAARGYDNKRFPWGNEEPEGQTVRANVGFSFKQTTAVGSFPDGAASGTGLMDMAGNVWEWCFDCFDERFYETSPEQDPVSISEKNKRVLRGGSWGSRRGVARCADRVRFRPGRPDRRRRFSLRQDPKLTLFPFTLLPFALR